MKDTLELAQKKYEKALETIAYLKQALYCFHKFDPENPKQSGNEVFKIAFLPEHGSVLENEVVFDTNNYTPGRTFLKNGCKDTQDVFGTNIHDAEMELRFEEYNEDKEDSE